MNCKADLVYQGGTAAHFRPGRLTARGKSSNSGVDNGGRPALHSHNGKQGEYQLPSFLGHRSRMHSRAKSRPFGRCFPRVPRLLLAAGPLIPQRRFSIGPRS